MAATYKAVKGGWRGLAVDGAPRKTAIGMGTAPYSQAVSNQYVGEKMMKGTVDSMSMERIALLTGQKGASGWRAAANQELYAADPELMKLAESENTILAQLRVKRNAVYSLTYEKIHDLIAHGLVQSPTDSKLIVKKSFKLAAGVITLELGQEDDAVADSRAAFRNAAGATADTGDFARGDELVFNGYKTTIGNGAALVFDNLTLSDLQGQLNGIQQRYSDLHVVETPNIPRQSYGRGSDFTTKSGSKTQAKAGRTWDKDIPE